MHKLYTHAYTSRRALVHTVLRPAMRVVFTTLLLLAAAPVATALLRPSPLGRVAAPRRALASRAHRHLVVAQASPFDELIGAIENMVTPKAGKGTDGWGPEDTVAVIGASGNVGRLAAVRLADIGACKVRAVSRDGDRAAGFLNELAPEIEVVTADTKDPASLAEALAGVSGLIVCTGTTAFPTLAWRGGNTPDAVDNLGIVNLLEAWKEARAAEGGAAKRLVLMSSIGVERRKVCHA